MTTQPLGIEGPELLALCVFQEARGEIDDGKAAVARVVLNRTKLKYSSDGSVEGTILHPDAFSWTQFDMVDGKYVKVAQTPEEQVEHVRACYAQALKSPSWLTCKNITDRVLSGAYDTPNYRLLTDKVVLYYAPAACRAPAWASADNLVAVIGRQWFFHA
jgi:hypothetical protein